jgi:hypothetical protein
MTERATAATMRSIDVTVVGASGRVGLVSSTPAGIECPETCSFDYPDMESVTLSAAAPLGYQFDGWSGQCSGAGACTLVASADRAVTATFSVDTTPYTLTTSAGAGGTVTSSPSGIDCGGTCQASFTIGTSITLQASAADGYRFQGWSGGPCDGLNGSCMFSIGGNTTVGAIFARDVLPDCSGGAVIFDDNGTNGYGKLPVVASDELDSPTDMAFVPGADNEFVVVGKQGTIWYFAGDCDPVNTIDLTSGATNIGVENVGEAGLTNVEFAPDFASNGFVYFYHTSDDVDTNSVSRMTFTRSGANAMVLSDPVRIIDLHKTTSDDRHNGGGLAFAPDGTLLISVGEGGDDENAQTTTNLVGKVLRIRTTSSSADYAYQIPAGNMFPAGNARCYAAASHAAACPEILALGVRNPYRLSIRGNVVFIGDVGSEFEEINRFVYTNATRNFGWSEYDGPTANPTLTGYENPIVAYERSDATAQGYRDDDPACDSCATDFASIIIGDVAGATRYDGELSGHLLHAEFMDGFVRALPVDSVGTPTGPGMHLVHQDGISAMVAGPDGYIYLVAQGGDWGTAGPNMVYRLVKP